MLVRQSDCGDFEHVGMCGPDRELDLDGRDVLATCLDDVLEAVLEPENPIIVEMAGIARVKPAMAESFRGRLGIVQITRHGLGAAIDDLPGAAGRKQLAVRCHDGDLYVDGRRADSTGMA